ISEVVARASQELDRLRRQHHSELVAVVSHGDVLRGLISHVLGMPLDLLHRLEVEPASVTVLSYAGGAPRLLLMNSTEVWPPEVSPRG
ncbi:MAG TPA: histidine phosphatase family protein, partial [Gemmatimonadales bacterium]|nr:histidine phosphatase family protein [Gemmatimonadales bacterium]